jgi:methylated-DNA-protein-cysteine methyltransferase related protein
VTSPSAERALRVASDRQPEAPGGGDGFEVSVRLAIARLRPGEVVTYGEIAREAGYDGAARAVGTLLSRDGSDLPWWRVVTSTGRLVPGSEVEHASRLRAEGVPLGGNPPRVLKRGRAVTGQARRRASRPG